MTSNYINKILHIDFSKSNKLLSCPTGRGSIFALSFLFGLYTIDR